MSRTRSEARLPIVAIIGRPNVGKSTIFNRFAGMRRAIVEDAPGVTRDRIAEEIEVGGRRVLIVDTAGLDPDAEAGLESAVQFQARTAVEQADAIFFVVDGRSGALPPDETLARTLHRSAKPILLAVNKVDTPKHEKLTAEFHRLGFARVRGVSGEHGSGAWDALEELVAEIPNTGPAPEPFDGTRVAVVGRPNVGKSSLVNRLAGEERVVVSEVPGTTRDAIDVHIETPAGHFVLVDTAGLRRPGRRDRLVERNSALVTVRNLERADAVLLVLDAHEGVTDQDAHIASLCQERGRATAVIANKWDLVEATPGRAETVAGELRHGLRFMPDAPVLRISARSGAGVARVLPSAQQLRAAAERRIPTSELNRWLRDTVARHEPAMAQRGQRKRPLKFFYATQTGVRPPTFVLFCTEPASLQPAYRRFLENQLRDHFELAGTPIRLRLRARSERVRGRPRGGEDEEARPRD
jgi:GTP-binding protein